MGEASKETTGIQCDKSQIGIGTGGCGNTQEESPASSLMGESSGKASQRRRPRQVREPGQEGEMAVLHPCTGLELRGSLALREL